MTRPTAELEASSLAATFAALGAGFGRAADRLGVRTHRLRLSTQTIELRVAGTAVADTVLPALRHLDDPDSTGCKPDLVVKVWDTASSGVRLPDLPGASAGLVARSYHEDELYLAFRLFESTVSALHVGLGESVHCMADARSVPPYDLAHPLAELLGWWLGRTGCYRVHAAAVGTQHGGVLLAGPSGAGKSTCALACLRAGMRFAGDDTVLVRAEPPAAISLFGSGRADRDLLARYPHVFPRLEMPGGEEKAVGFFGPETMTGEIPLRAVVLPRVVPGGRCRLLPGRRAAALLALAPWVMLHSPGGSEQALRTIRSLLASLPVRALEVGDDLARIPELLSALVGG